MDKYEYKIRADEIKALIAKEDYAQAAEIADTIDWRRVKSVMMLCTISDLYKINRRYEDAKNMLLLAYERRPGGRTICYSLCELCIKTEDVVQALKYYKEFVQVAPRDTGRFILQYKIYEAQEVSLEERIGVLEEMKRRDYREKWAYELAYLYHRMGLATRCVEECDELILWFGDGKYVVKAMELKMLHQPLSPAQQEIYDRRFEEVPEEDGQGADGSEFYEESADYGGQPDMGQEPDGCVTEAGQFAEDGQPMDEEAFGQMGERPYGQPENGWPEGDGRSLGEMGSRSAEDIDERSSVDIDERSSISTDDLDIHVKTMDVGQYNTINLQAELAAGLQEVLGAEEMADSGQESQGQPESIGLEQKGYEDFASEEMEESEVFFGATGEIEDMPWDGQELGVEAGMDAEAVSGGVTAEEEQTGLEPDEARLPEPEPDERGLAQLRQTAEQQRDGVDFAKRQSAGAEDAERWADAASAEEVGQQPVAAEAAKGQMQAQQSDAVGMVARKESREDLPEDETARQVMEQLRSESAESGQLPRELAEVLSQEANGQISLVLPESAAIEKQITGQMKIDDILLEWERMKKENEEKRKEEVRMHILHQTGPMFTEFEAAVRDGLLEQLEKGAADKEESGSQEQALAGEAENSAQSGAKMEEEVRMSAEDIAGNVPGTGTMDTGAGIGEADASEYGADATEEGLEYIEEVSLRDELEALEDNNSAEGPEYMEEAGRGDGEDYLDMSGSAGELEYIEDQDYVEADLEEEPGYGESSGYGEALENLEETGNEDGTDFKEESGYEKDADYGEEFGYEEEPGYGEESGCEEETGYEEELEYEDGTDYGEEANYTDKADQDAEAGFVGTSEEDEPNLWEEEGIQEADIIEEIEEGQEQAVKADKRPKPAKLKKQKAGETYETEDGQPIERDQEKVRSLSREEKELFAPFIQSRHSKEQLIKAIDSLSMAAYTGNLIVTGEEGIDMLTLAKNIVRDIQVTDRNFSGKVAKITGQGLNDRKIEETLEWLNNGALIIEAASGMSAETAARLHRALQQERLGIIIIMEDTKKAMKKLFLSTPELDGDFTARIDLEALSNDTLVAFGKQYAREMEYSIDDLGMLALHTRIEELQTIDHVVTVAEVKQIVDEAIHHASRKTLGHFLDVLLARRYDDEDMIILTEKDFVA